jgi:hypothetical protein
MGSAAHVAWYTRRHGMCCTSCLTVRQLLSPRSGALQCEGIVAVWWWWPCCARAYRTGRQARTARRSLIACACASPTSGNDTPRFRASPETRGVMHCVRTQHGASSVHTSSVACLYSGPYVPHSVQHDHNDLEVGWRTITRDSTCSVPYCRSDSSSPVRCSDAGSIGALTVTRTFNPISGLLHILVSS